MTSSAQYSSASLLTPIQFFLISQRGAREFQQIKSQFEITPDPELLVKRGFLPHPAAVLHRAVKVIPEIAVVVDPPHKDGKNGRRKSLAIIREQAAEESLAEEKL